MSTFHFWDWDPEVLAFCMFRIVGIEIDRREREMEYESLLTVHELLQKLSITCTYNFLEYLEHIATTQPLWTTHSEYSEIERDMCVIEHVT